MKPQFLLSPLFPDTGKSLLALGLMRALVRRGMSVQTFECGPDFSDAALTGIWPGNALELLRLCRKLEQEAGRPADHSSRESRTLDLDLILFGDEVRNTPELTLPHPRAQQRRFVLEPLAELIPEARFPDTGRKIEECLRNLPPEH